MADFLNDKAFLQKINHHKVRTYKAAITVLDFMTEQPLARLEGKVVSGNLQVAANSSLRRTGSLTVVFDDDTKEITNINNLISINKKISVSIGFKNPYYDIGQYREYGEYLWFPQGTFFITAASSTRSASSATVSVTIQDKMAGLNGTCGGIIPATTSFHDKIIYDANGDYTTEYPLIKEIIREAVHHFGGEHFSRICIEDVPDVGRTVVRWSGNKPVYFQNPEMSSGERESGVQISTTKPKELDKWQRYANGDRVGYKETDLTYPGELIQKGGTAVTAVLDTIVKALGNYEYFYDVEGVFHFRQIKNYQATGLTPLNYSINLDKETVNQSDTALWNLYLKSYGDMAFVNEFADASLITQASYNPKYDNIKNDFVVWGTKNANGNDTAGMVRYHLAIDEKPQNIVQPIKWNWSTGRVDNKTNRNFDPGSSGIDSIVGNDYSLCHKDIYVVKDSKTKLTLRYQTSTDINKGEKCQLYVASLDSLFNNLVDPLPADETESSVGETVEAHREARELQRQKYFFNWREELYRRALLAYGSSAPGSYYDEELLAEWRKIFDPNSTIKKKGSDSFEQGWKDYFGDDKNNPWYGFNVDVIRAPEKLSYWLDIIDTTAPIGQFGVNRIGRRTKVSENSQIDTVFEAETPDRVFVVNPGDPEKMQQIIDSYNAIGQAYCFISPTMEKNFTNLNSFGTCYEDIRDMLYTNLMYNATVSITCIPLFYLDVNRIIHLNLVDLGIVGDYVINTMSWQIGSNNTMSLSVTEAKVEI